ncbi:hypothetical protein C2E23DRAFT_805811 [Lenzites betulinus]|nr:hypothetical protein C2E23DRAFT_805811 [Lenzites betulinus]
MYGFMAIVVLLFLASMCVIKRVRLFLSPSPAPSFPLLRTVPALPDPPHTRPELALTLSRRCFCIRLHSARKRSGSRRSTRSAAAGASSNPGRAATRRGATPVRIVYRNQVPPPLSSVPVSLSPSLSRSYFLRLL